MLKLFYDKADDVPANLKEFYEEKGGKFQLKVEGGFKTQADIDRVTASLTKERTDHGATKGELAKAKTDLASFEGLNPEEVHQKLGEYDTLKATAGQTPDAAKIEAEITRRVDAAVKIKVTPLQRQLQDANTALGESNKKVEGLNGTLQQRTIDDAVRQVALDARANPQAVGDFLSLARGDLQLGEDGKTVTTKDGLDLKTYINDQKGSRPWLWPAAQGAGAGGSQLPGGASGKNPWARETWDVTAQGAAVQADRAGAEKLAQAAGTTIAAGKPAPVKAAA